MKAHVLTGSKQEIAERLVRIDGEVREVIVFEDEAVPSPPEEAPDQSDDIFAEMAPFLVEASPVDDSRAAIYARTECECSCSTPTCSCG